MKRQVERNGRIARLRFKGWTFHNIGVLFGISRQRAWQIFKVLDPVERYDAWLAVRKGGLR